MNKGYLFYGNIVLDIILLIDCCLALLHKQYDQATFSLVVIIAAHIASDSYRERTRLI